MENKATEMPKPDLGYSPASDTPLLMLEQKDVGNLDQVLRGYYLSQIKKLKTRRERKMARRLLENHMVLPKSRRRTSKDAAYIHEVVGVGPLLLGKLEQFRLIRRLDKTGNNPIYEISHDTLVEPILAERRNRESISAFLKKNAKWLLLLLLLLFGLGMLFESVCNVLDDKLGLASVWSGSTSRSVPHQTVHLDAREAIFASKGTNRETLTVPFGDVQEYAGSDSLTLMVGVDVTAHPDLDIQAGGDTISLDLGPVVLPISAKQLQALINAQKDTALPIRTVVPVGDSDKLMADVKGTALLILGSDMMARGIDGANARLAPDNTDANKRLGEITAQKDLGRKTVQAQPYYQSVRLDTTIALAPLVKDDQVAYDIMQGKRLRLTYRVDIRPMPEQPPTTVVDYKEVKGIELEYADGTKAKLQKNPAPGSNQRVAPPTQPAVPVTHTVKPGENLFKISTLYGVSVEEIRRLNNLPNNNIRVGQVLRIK